MATRTLKDKTTRAEQNIENAEPSAGEFLRPDFAMLQLVARPFEFWLRCQHDVLTAVEPAAKGWLERRREGAEAMLEAIEKLASCGDLSDVASVQRQWLEGAMKRLESDFRALGEQAVVFSQEAVSATRYAAQSSTEAVSLALHKTAQKAEAIEQAAE